MKKSILVIIIAALVGAYCLFEFGIIGICKNNQYTSQRYILGSLRESKNVNPQELPSGWSEEKVDPGTRDEKFEYHGSIMGRFAKIKLYNTTKQEKKFSCLLFQFDTEDQPIAQEKIEYILKPNRQITKELKLERGAVTIDVLHGSTKYVDGWQDSLYLDDLVGKEPVDSKFVITSSSGVNNDCAIFIANDSKPKRIAIKITRLDKFKDGKVLKTDNYTYELGYNRQIKRNFPRIEGEEFCRVETTVM